MKIVFCGPPHSGKSVFIANLRDKLPSDAYTIIRACPDGEGSWSNNKDQEEISMVRKKGKFTKTFIDDSCVAIDNQINKIVIVDVGGVMSKENEQIFRHCDSFVILSSDEEKKKEWLEFGERLGLECIGCIDSSLEGKEEIYSRTPYLQGRIVGLERGEILEDSLIINALSSDIVRKSKYALKEEIKSENFTGNMIDDTELGFELGYGKEILTEDGIPMKKVKWKEEALPMIYKKIQGEIDPNKPLKINGIRATFILSGICKAAKQMGVKDISAYDIRLKQYIPIKQIPKQKGIKQARGLSYNIIENTENIFMDIDITNEKYSLEDYEEAVLPEIKEGKNLYLSGRMPLWLLASISNSYDSNRIFTFQPGKGFTCISSIDLKEVGTVVDGIDGINLDKYFEDKKEKAVSNLPVMPAKKGIFSKIKGWFEAIKENREKAKYLDNTIRSVILSQTDTTSSTNTFMEGLKESNLDKPEPNKNVSPKGISDQAITKTDFGGKI